MWHFKDCDYNYFFFTWINSPCDLKIILIKICPEEVCWKAFFPLGTEIHNDKPILLQRSAVSTNIFVYLLSKINQSGPWVNSTQTKRDGVVSHSHEHNTEHNFFWQFLGLCIQSFKEPFILSRRKNLLLFCTFQKQIDREGNILNLKYWKRKEWKGMDGMQ